MKDKRYGPNAAFMSALAYSRRHFGTYVTRVRNGVTREHYPWDKIHLAKAERRGKTYEELQAMRKQKYEEEDRG
jgi:hypothetical protein